MPLRPFRNENGSRAGYPLGRTSQAEGGDSRPLARFLLADVPPAAVDPAAIVAAKPAGAQRALV